MLKVILVDDDRNVREYIKKVIDWENEGFMVCGESANGEKGIQLANECKPDIIILDLEMPVMDGIEMLKILKEKNIDTKVVVLSCHDQFEYVKDAMQLGAFDYILKHKMKSDDFLRILRNLKQLIINEQNVLSNIDRERVLLDILMGADTSCRDICNTLGIDSIEDYNHVVISLEMDYYNRNVKITGDLEIESVMKVLIEFISDTFVSLENHVYCRLDKSFVALVSIMKTKYNIFELRKALETVLKNSQNKFKSHTGYTFSAGISNSCNNYTEIPNYWKESITALDNKFYKGTDSIIFYNEVSNSSDLTRTNQKLEEFKSAINDKYKGLEALDCVFGAISSECIKQDLFLRVFHTMVYTLTAYVEKLGMKLEEVFDTHNYLFRVQTESETLDDYRTWFIDLYNRVNETHLAHQEKKFRKEIIEALDYINSNFKKELTLEEVSNHINISRTYFSQLFKKETCESFSNYITKLRLKKAKELLSMSNMKIYSIAFAVGFQSHHYFNNIFKEYEGMTPNQYRQQNSSAHS